MRRQGELFLFSLHGCVFLCNHPSRFCHLVFLSLCAYCSLQEGPAVLSLISPVKKYVSRAEYVYLSYHREKVVEGGFFLKLNQ